MALNCSAVQLSEHDILIDIQMPVMKGCKAARAIRASDDKALASIPIVAMNEDKKQAFDSGMNAHAAKPFDINDLMELLDEILNEKDGSSAS